MKAILEFLSGTNHNYQQMTALDNVCISLEKT